MRRLPLLLALVLILSGCRSTPPQPTAEANPGEPRVRVRLQSGVSSVKLTADAPPLLATADHPTPRPVVLPEADATLTLAGGRWRLNGVEVGTGDLALFPAAVGTLQIGGKPYRGHLVFVPADANSFDVVNHVDLDGYLKGVVAEELLKTWDPAAYRAQTVAARTYALYEIQSRPPDGRAWDVYDDTRSQVYGGLDAETDKSIDAVERTSGLVLAYGPAGGEKIFKAYFSACCGGVTASAHDVFDDADIPPLSAQSVGTLCAASPTFTWPDVKIDKPELTRRLRAWGRGMGAMAPVDHIDVAAKVLGRPVGFEVVDAKGTRYRLKSDELRTAVNAAAPKGGPTLRSGFCTPVASADAITFTAGHGWGHGVGLCQWGTEARAEQGMAYEAILAAAYPQSKLVRAY